MKTIVRTGLVSIARCSPAWAAVRPSARSPRPSPAPSATSPRWSPAPSRPSRPPRLRAGAGRAGRLQDPGRPARRPATIPTTSTTAPCRRCCRPSSCSQITVDQDGRMTDGRGAARARRARGRGGAGIDAAQRTAAAAAAAGAGGRLADSFPKPSCSPSRPLPAAQPGRAASLRVGWTARRPGIHASAREFSSRSAA